MAAPKNAPSSDAKAVASKMHRRSRSGCFTCRLRRKKCEEGKPACKACKHLGLRCDYKRPMWWSNGEQRRAQKDLIKNIIKRTQVSKKQQQSQQQPLDTSSPPPLSHSVPTSAEAPFAESFTYSRCSPEGSPFSSNGCDFTYQSPDGYFTMPPPPQPYVSGHPQYPLFSPYEVDIKTEREIYVNNVPTRRDSTISTFSTFQPPPGPHGMPNYPADSWVQQEHFESTSEEFAEEPVDFNFFEYPHGPVAPERETVIIVDDADKYLLNHFLDKVLKLIFPILDANQHGSARDVIIPALESNKAYLHCCLSVAATHMKATEGVTDEQIDNDIVRHRYAAVSELCEALGQDIDHDQILEATLGMIFFQCSVGRPDDTLPDIPWHQHFQAAASLVNKLDLPAMATELSAAAQHPSFNMTLTSWIDILGSTIMGRSPMFADTYRELNMTNGTAGLAELMGCDDKIMFLISEIACLDVQKQIGIDEVVLCKYVESLAQEIGTTEPAAGTVQSCFSASGAIRPKQLAINLTAVFRVAARIYLCTLVPGNTRNQPSMCHLISQFSELMSYIPAGPDGFDRSLAWPLLIAGGASVANSPFRAMFEERCERLGDGANFGSFGRIRELLKDLWQINDAAAAQGDYQGVRWRDVMQQKGWDFLLI
ncbi:related to Transcriptional regulatory pro1 [Lecanosticta acicola]|uniref:Related to Transcriptional regulatory pro1 n=1 Tax=Lecanosticta acicola TaxID=111012 RepID=A0AAI9E813_9PEZI|nr:related to Transcriptional regulatory pro1 [Lecanosticta acicola]